MLTLMTLGAGAYSWYWLANQNTGGSYVDPHQYELLAFSPMWWFVVAMIAVGLTVVGICIGSIIRHGVERR